MTNDRTPSFTFSTMGAVETGHCRYDAEPFDTCGTVTQQMGPYAPCTSPHDVTLAPPSTPYPYQFEVRVTDAAGNPWSAYRDFTYAP